MRVFYAAGPDGNCGTTACAAGYAALRPEFPGLTLSAHGRIPLETLMDYFDLSIKHVDDIFFSDFDATPEEVADKIEKLLSEGE
jgi:hypothetical protein